MKFAVTNMSSKGQIVIPVDIRTKLNLVEGEVLGISSQEGLIVLKKIENEMSKDDIATLEKIKEAWEEIGNGKSKKMSSEMFLREISKW
jgi:AbrB family looped-hinge helix DNA binding protein